MTASDWWNECDLGKIFVGIKLLNNCLGKQIEQAMIEMIGKICNNATVSCENSAISHITKPKS